MHEENLSENRTRKKECPGQNSNISIIIFLKIDYVKDLLKKSNCDIL